MEIHRRKAYGQSSKRAARITKKSPTSNISGNNLSEIPTHLPPSRPITAFFVFILNNRNQFQKKHVGLRPQEITAMMGEVWRNMSMEEKQPYFDKAEEEKQRYNRQKREFEMQGFYYDVGGNIVTEIRRLGKRKAYDVKVAKEDLMEEFGEDEEEKPTDQPKQSKESKRETKQTEQQPEEQEQQPEQQEYIPRTKKRITTKKY